MVLFAISIPLSLREFSSVYPFITLKKSSLLKSTLPQPSFIQTVGHLFGGFSILCTHFGHFPSIEFFLYFFEAKRLGYQLSVSFNGVVGRALLSLFQQSYKGFKGKFLKIRCNKRDLTLLDEFPLYWTHKPNFQGARCLEDMPQWDQEVCLFFSSLKVVFDTTTLIKQEFSPVGLKAYMVSFVLLLLLMLA